MNVRNIAFVGHPSSGKTTLVDALAFSLGASDRKGSVGDKTSICDTEPEEQERQHTLQLSAVHAKKDGTSWNLLDTPGYPEFIADATSAMFAAEMTVGVVSCGSGVTFNVREKLNRAAGMNRGRAIVVTHVDGENADFEALVRELRSKVGEQCVPVMMPDQSGSGFSSVSPIVEGDWRKRLMDRVMDACEDEDVVMEYLETEVLSDELLQEHTPNAIEKGALIPTLVCNPESGVGVDEVISYLKQYGPSPSDNHSFTSGGEPFECTDDGPLAAVVFNVKSDPHVGKICLVRVQRGQLSASELVGPGKGEKLGGLFHVVGGRTRNSVDSAGAGEIVGFSKVEGIGWGESFSTAGAEVTQIDIPKLQPPMVTLAIEPKSRGDEQKIGPALTKLSAEDPTFITEHDPYTHQLVMHGMSDLHLKVVEERMKRRYGVEITTALPRIAYRETITKASEGHHRHKKQSGGRGQFGECYVRVKPGAEGTGIVFNDKVVGGSIPKNLIPAVEKGVKEIAGTGILTDSQVVDCEIELYDGKFHAVDSDEASFKRAGGLAFKDGFMKAGPVLLEPIMAIDIRIPTDDAGTIFSDLTSQRRGTVIDQTSEHDGAITVVKAHVPLSTMLTYLRDLKSQTAGEGSFAMHLDRYARVPANEQQRIISEASKTAEEE